MSSIFVRFLSGLVLATALGCAPDDPRGPGSADGGTDPTGRRLDGGLDGGPCRALGCDELGYECGKAVDNCGDPLDCDPPGKVNACTAPERCGGDPDRGTNKCGCKTRTNACEAQGAQCGMIDECGKAVDCGTCKDGALCLGNKCACTPSANPCGARVCGTASDSCGASVTCGPSNGQCGSGTCDVAGQCTCRPRAVACQGRLDAYTENGCSYDCSSSCVPDDARACAGAECGTARNNCGDEVRCGACAAGSTCVAPQHVVESTLPARTANYQGGYCVANNAAQMVGKYATRLHSFRQAGSGLINFLNRAEAVSFMDIRFARATGRLKVTEKACVATGTGDPSSPLGAGTRSWVPKYRNIAPVTNEFRVNGARWTRDEPPHPVIGTGEPSGWLPGMPSYCIGREGQEVDLPAGDPRRGQAWLPDDRCVCPTAAAAAVLPRRSAFGDPSNYSTTALRDCRIADDDRDEKPGVSGRAKSLLFDSEIYTATTGHGVWSGPIREDRHHLGQVVGSARPLSSVTLGCRAMDAACSAPGLDCVCADNLQTVQLVPLADSAALDCGVFFRAGGVDDVEDQTAIDRQFGVAFGSCSGATPGQCPEGSICRGSRCFVFTAKGACAPETCPGGGCEGCPSGTSCRDDGACWPTAAACPARGVGGALCGR